MLYSFRIRLKLPDQQRIGIDSDKLLLTPENSMPEIVLRSKPQEAPIAGANELVLCRDGYSSEEEALTQGEQLKDVLILALSHSHIGADFGDRAPRGWATDYCLRMLEQGTGKRILNDVPGVMTFETESSPLTLRAQAGIVMTHVQKKFEPAFHRAFKLLKEIILKIRPKCYYPVNIVYSKVESIGALCVRASYRILRGCKFRCVLLEE